MFGKTAKRTGLGLAAFVIGLSVGSGAVAQSDVALVTRSAKLQDLSENLKRRDASNRKQVEDLARRLGIPVRRELPNGKVIELQRVAPGIGPIFYVTNNEDAADTVSTDEVWPGGSSGLNLDGNGMTVGQWDAGAVFSDHPDLYDRVSQVDGSSEISEHSTHVAGTLIGSGEGEPLQRARGMAFAANLNAYDWNSDTAEMAAEAATGLLTSNHSYGIAAGWIYMGGSPPDNWWWIGGQGDEDPNFGYYDTETQLWDQIAYDAPYYLIVKAAGNDRWDIGPDPGEQYTIVDQLGNFITTSTDPRSPDCSPAGYDCIPGYSVAKNILTVGSVDDLIGGYSPLAGPSAVKVSGFSGLGPTDDGRIKPDVVGNGDWLTSTWWPGTNSEFGYYYFPLLGTSQAAPNVTGSLLLLQEHHQDLRGTGSFMRAATLKGLAIHTADEAGNSAGPDYESGWGLLNTRTAADLITEDAAGGGDHRIVEGSLSAGAVDSYTIDVTEADSVLKATLVWTDPPGTPAEPSLDPADLMLVNDLDLRITKGPSIHMPWVLDPASPAAAATKGDNFRDNVEQVVVSGGATGSYSVEVSHKGTLVDAPQPYSLIISLEPAPPSGSTLIIDEDFSGGLPPGWTIQTLSGASWTINDPDPTDWRHDNFTGGTGKFAMVDNQSPEGRVFRTVTSLRTPVLDLSSAAAVVLRFNSFFWFDFFESVNVDASTNSGSSWTNVWRREFDSHLNQFAVDLTNVAAGQSSVMLRFRFDSEGDRQGDLWQIDDVQLEDVGGPPPPPPLPGQASNPNPTDGASNVDIHTDLSWTGGSNAESHNVYFGTSSPPAFQGNHGGTGFDPGTLSPGTTYHWRIDEVNATGTTTGDVWSFTTEAAPPVQPTQASNPSPASGASNVDINADLTWAAGSGAESHNVYFGTNSPPTFRDNQTATSFDPGTLSYGTIYYWRIDEVNTAGTTAGTQWSFTTAAAPPPPPTEIHLKNLVGSSIPGSRGRWSAQVQIEVVDTDGAPVSGVLVEGVWINGANGGATCTANASGMCTVQKDNLKSSLASVVFTVDNLSGANMDYVPAANEADSTITVFLDGPPENLLPVAVDDSYITTVGVPVTGNVMQNDNPGDVPATVTSYDNTSARDVSISINPDGSFTYTPPSGYVGTDSFGYTITDASSDTDAATVSITINATPAGPTLSVSSFRDKGIWFANLIWSGLTGTEVTITRDGPPISGSPTENDGSHSDELGKKVGGSYAYEVCETGGSSCASATLQF